MPETIEVRVRHNEYDQSTSVTVFRWPVTDLPGALATIQTYGIYGLVDELDGYEGDSLKVYAQIVVSSGPAWLDVSLEPAL